MATASFTRNGKIKLKLSDEEARVLKKILNNVGGYPSTGRGQADKICSALSCVGVSAGSYDTHGSITFES